MLIKEYICRQKEEGGEDEFNQAPHPNNCSKLISFTIALRLLLFKYMPIHPYSEGRKCRSISKWYKTFLVCFKYVFPAPRFCSPPPNKIVGKSRETVQTIWEDSPKIIALSKRTVCQVIPVFGAGIPSELYNYDDIIAQEIVVCLCVSVTLTWLN